MKKDRKKGMERGRGGEGRVEGEREGGGQWRGGRGKEKRETGREKHGNVMEE